MQKSRQTSLRAAGCNAIDTVSMPAMLKRPSGRVARKSMTSRSNGSIASVSAATVSGSTASSSTKKPSSS